MKDQSSLSLELSRGVSNDVLLDTPKAVVTKHVDDGACYDTDTASPNGYSASLSTPSMSSARTSVISRRQSTVFGELEQQLTDTLSHDGVATVSPQGATPSNSMTPIPKTPPPTSCHGSPCVKSSPTRWFARYLSKHHSAFQVVLNAVLKQEQIDGTVTVVHNSTNVTEEEQPMPHNPLMVLLYECTWNNIHTTIAADLSKVEEDRHVEVTGWIGALKSNVTSVFISNEDRKPFDQFVTDQRLVILSSCQRSVESDEDEVQQIMVTGIDELIVAAVRNQFCVMIHV